MPQNADKITFTMPHNINLLLEKTGKEMHLSKSELLRISFLHFHKEYKKNKMKNAAEIMKNEYLTDKELTFLNELDGEDFKGL